MTSTTLRNQALFWLLALFGFLALVYLFRAVLLPFVLGAVIAYLLNPLVAWLGRRQVPRTAAVSLILLLFTAVVVVLLLLLIPPLYHELVQLARGAPDYIDALLERLQPFIQNLQQQVDQDNLEQSLREALRDNVSSVLNVSTNVLAGLLSSGQAVIGFFTVVLLSPLVSFLLMLEWPTITRWIDGMIPRQHYDRIRELLTRIDTKIAGFIRGQLLVALVLGILYALALSIAGLRFGFLIGAGAGLLSIIPLFGSTVGLLVAATTAWFQSGEIGYVGLIAAIFIGGQVLEGNVITPRLMGKSVGLHPIWILFALLAGGAFLGIAGMLLAIPVAATIGVLAQFGVEEYKASHYYQDQDTTL
ncbi:MAG: AI-2E family transporter [Pseudomonadales bacterium]